MLTYRLNLNRKGNFYFRILFFLILVSILTVTSLALLINRLYIQDISANYQENYRLNLQEINQDFDELINEVQNAYGSLIQSPEVYAYLNSKDFDAFISNKAFIQARLAKNSVPQVLSIFIINKDLDYQIATDTYNVAIDDFLAEESPIPISSTKENIFLTDVNFLYEQALDAPHTLSLKFLDSHLADTEQRYIIINLEPRYINEVFLKHYDSELIVIDMEGELIFQNDHSTYERLMDQNYIDMIVASGDNQNSMEFYENGERKLLSYIHNDVTDTYIVQINSYDAIISAIRNINRGVMTAAGIFLPLTMLVMLFITRSIYKPVENLTEALMDYDTYNNDHHDEIQSILSAYENIFHQAEYLETQNSNQATELAETKLKKLLRGTPLKPEETDIVNDLVYKQQNQMMVVLKLDNYKDIDDTTVLKNNLLIRRILMNVLSDNYKFYYTNINREEWVLLLSFTNEENNSFSDLTATLKHLQEAIEDNINYSATIGIGSAVNSINDYALAYRKARAMCRQRLILGYRQIIHSNMPSRQLKSQDQLPVERLDALNSAIKQLDKEGYSEILKELMTYLKSFEHDSAINIIYETAISCIRTMNSRINQPSRHVSFSSFLSAIMDVEILEQYIPAFESEFDIYTAVLKETQVDINDKHREVVEEIKSYIETEYCNPNMTIDIIAEHVDYSPYYISKKFKEITGINLNDYILQKRMAHAKNLLKSSNLKVKEISLKVGIENTSYFGTLFKKEVGFTPIAYKQYSSESS